MSESQATPIAEAFATGAEIAPIVDKIEESLAGVQRTHALIALCSTMLLLQAPSLNEKQLFEGVKDVSRFICLWLDGSVVPPGEPTSKNLLN